MSSSNNKSELSPVFHTQRIYVKDISFSSPKSPLIFNESWNPEVSFEVSTDSSVLSENTYEVSLSLNVVNKIKDEVVFTCDVEYAGIFSIANLSKADLEHTLGAYCPNIIYPYARESISSLVVKGSFPQLNLGPINFDAFHAAKKEKAAQESQSHKKSTVDEKSPSNALKEEESV